MSTWAKRQKKTDIAKLYDLIFKRLPPSC
jgi:hypothetical protein